MTRGQWLVAAVLLMLVWIWPRMHRNKWWTAASLSLIMFMALVHQLVFRATIAEDAYITFRYALNLASGNGPVFNPGERVEGYSNFLWMIVLSALHRLFGIDIPLIARVLGVGAALLTIVLTYRLSLKVTEGHRHASLIAALIVAASGSFVAYGPSGMETSLFVLLTVSTVLCTISELWTWTGLLVGLSTMTRPEGLLFLPPLAGWILLTRKPLQDRLRHILVVTGSFSALVLPWTLWRWQYYGHLIPNALQAKMGMDIIYQILLGIKYLYEFGLAHAPLLVILAVVTAAVLANRSRTDFASFRPIDRLLGSVVIVFVLFVVSVGGDWMPAWRFLAPIVPLGSVLLLSLWHVNIKEPGIQTSSPSGIVVFAVVSWLLFVTSYSHPKLAPFFVEWSYKVEGLSEIGRWFNRSLPPGTLVATYANGALSYYSGLPTIDMLGLTDEHIARSGHRDPKGWPGHIAYDYEYVARRRPSVVIFTGWGFDADPGSCGQPGEKFRPLYVTARFRFPQTNNPLGQYVGLYLLRSEKENLVNLLTSKSGVEIVCSSQ